MRRIVLFLIFTPFIFQGCGVQHPAYSNVSFAKRKEMGLPSSGKYRSIRIADMDGDGNPDIIGSASYPGTLAIWYGDGRGGMSAPQFLPVRGDVRSVDVADFNGDGRKDIVFSVQKEASGIMIWLNQPGRKWFRGNSPIEGNSYEGVQTLDINRDGHRDIAAANTTADARGGIQIWTGDGKGNWTAESGPTVSGIFMDVLGADFNHDGIPDLAASGWGTYGELRVWLGDGKGGWASVSGPKEGNYYSLTDADFNDDGHPDILAGTYRQGIKIFLGNGRGNFQEMSPPVTKGSYWKVVATDMDGDGLRDILASSLDAEGIKVWLQKKDKKEKIWEAVRYIFPGRGIFYDMQIADVDKDGKDDLCAASFGEGIRLWLGKGGISLSSEEKNISLSGHAEKKTASDETDENQVYTTVSGYPEYKIGPGDVLEITVWERAEGKKEEVFVRPDGKISFGFVEDMEVKGLTPNQLDERLTEDLKYYIRSPRLDVIVKNFGSKYVTFTGEVYTNVNFRSGPGKYELTGKTTVLDMLSRIGGPTQKANLREVRIRNQNGRTFRIDLYRTINFGDRSQDAVLDKGDLVFIPAITKEASRVYVFGEVKKPGVYTFTGSEMQLFDAVSQAGGLSIFATPGSTRIVRGDITHPEVLSADLEALMAQGDKSQNIALKDGDLVYVPRGMLGDIHVFFQKISPILELIYAPARIDRLYE